MDTKEHYKPIYLLLICLSTILHQTLAFGSTPSAKVLCIKKEREALLEFKRGLIDENNLLSSWKNDEDNEECCSWRGVKCSNTTGHILVLNLRGSIESNPDDTKDLTLRANISSSRLSVLDISYNGYSSPAIYSWLFNFTSLTSLDLSGNNLGQIVSAFGYLKSLEHLRLYGSGIQGGIPKSVENLSHLCSLDARSNNLSQPFSELLNILSGSNRSLEFLSFEDNALTGSLINLTIFSSLRELRLRNNLLNGIFHESFRQISSLEYLDLSNSQMTGPLPDLALFPSLKELRLGGNHFNGEAFRP
ncbi:PREDICTED: LRR receptor-like serine/threonine-protein kinase FLS2 [Nicotiana attenuata]|uniref:Lrr receptor-like serinethreonine-protein kinase erecta n=1 Tax=Nicotiana attenuata TaxID=49451 RepID=A0A1J6IL19_NICAT|nr:PREDICTED: LRR receptor-like serine/threonine-protein kinase FLS2 [Nicotiana attenuata]OIS95848.1 lrr receptor-like serinethreonine-protein kinase erecta [Nicotiana attenuata]